MNIKEINGAQFKKLLSASRCYYRYHNKSKNGGNFGFEMRGLIGGRELELWGHYSANGEIHHLAIGSVFGRKNEIDKLLYADKQSLINLIKSICCDIIEE